VTHAQLLNCGGGGFASDTWNRIRADVLGRDLRRLAVRDPGALGAAALGAVAAGLQPDLDTALADAVRYDTTYSPDG
jgi:sugar (pentulose or hexulose) kinase